MSSPHPDSPCGTGPDPGLVPGTTVAPETPGLIHRLWRRWLGIGAHEIRFAERGFRGGDGRLRERLERSGSFFREGYHAGLEVDEVETLATRLATFPVEAQGFAYEGAAMAWALRDAMVPWRRSRVARLLEGPGDRHAYMVHVGVGWAWARLPGGFHRRLHRFDSLLRWLVVDGYGFHEGFFSVATWRRGPPAPARLRGYARRAFDQGLGRSFWFSEGGELAGFLATLSHFSADRHSDLWSGWGLACAYAGGLEDYLRLVAIAEAAGLHQPALAQGAAFATKARLRAGNLVPHTELVCRVFTGHSAARAAECVDGALVNLPAETRPAVPAYETWRQRVQQSLTRIPCPA